MLEIAGDDVVHTVVRALRFGSDAIQPSGCAAHIPIYVDPGEGSIVMVEGSGGRAAIRVGKYNEQFVVE